MRRKAMNCTCLITGVQYITLHLHGTKQTSAKNMFEHGRKLKIHANK